MLISIFTCYVVNNNLLIFICVNERKSRLSLGSFLLNGSDFGLTILIFYKLNIGYFSVIYKLPYFLIVNVLKQCLLRVTVCDSFTFAYIILLSSSTYKVVVL